jgi:hypothetical protein
MAGFSSSQASPGAGVPSWTAGNNAKPLGYQQITTLSSAQTLTVPAGATMALVKAETQAVRWRDDGTNPTATVGMPLLATDPYLFVGVQQLAVIAFIEQTASAKLNISYY